MIKKILKIKFVQEFLKQKKEMKYYLKKIINRIKKKKVNLKKNYLKKNYRL